MTILKDKVKKIDSKTEATYKPIKLKIICCIILNINK